MILRQVDELDLECEENNDMRVIDEQVKFYKDEVNKILVEFRDLDQNGVCYSLFSNKSEGIGYDLDFRVEKVRRTIGTRN